jgi:hypothetical protein
MSVLVVDEFTVSGFAGFVNGEGGDDESGDGVEPASMKSQLATAPAGAARPRQGLLRDALWLLPDLLRPMRRLAADPTERSACRASTGDTCSETDTRRARSAR